VHTRLIQIYCILFVALQFRHRFHNLFLIEVYCLFKLIILRHMFFWSRANARLVAQVRRNRLRSRDSERLATLAHARGNRHQRRRRSGKSHSKRSSPHHHTRRRVVRKRLRARVMRRSRFDMLLDRKLNLFPLTRLKILLSHYPPPLLSLIFTFDGMLLILSSLLHRWGVRDGQWLMLLLEMMEHHK